MKEKLEYLNSAVIEHGKLWYEKTGPFMKVDVYNVVHECLKVLHYNKETLSQKKNDDATEDLKKSILEQINARMRIYLKDPLSEKYDPRFRAIAKLIVSKMSGQIIMKYRKESISTKEGIVQRLHEKVLLRCIELFKIDEDAKFYTFFFYRLRGECINIYDKYLNNAERQATDANDYLENIKPQDDFDLRQREESPEEEVEFSETMEKAMNLLTVKEKKIIHLMYIENYKRSECARELNMPYSSVEIEEKKALNKLQKFF